jgi:ABC-2 type transport system permease protein
VIRDLPGLGLLFLMPALLLIVITLTQEKVMTGMDSGTRVALVNLDRSALGDSIEADLKKEPGIHLTLYESLEEAESRVFRGDHQVLVYIPDSTTEKLGNPGMTAGIRILYDPAMMKLYKDIMGTSLQSVIESNAAEYYTGALVHSLEITVAQMIGFKFELPRPAGDMKQLVSIDEGIAGGQEFLLEYNIVRNNVPAFILFAMFFIVIPLAGSILNEKQQGTRDRLLTLPISWALLFSGKVAVYLVVCIAQFLVMIAIGRFLIPLICQLPPLPLDVNILALAAITLAAGLAAIGFGLLIGTFSSTFHQAAPIGSVLVVVLAILGGIFVPSYMMPEAVEKISVISPLRWGTDAYYSIFARYAGLENVLGQFLLLLAFFIISLILSFQFISKRV